MVYSSALHSGPKKLYIKHNEANYNFYAIGRNITIIRIQFKVCKSESFCSYNGPDTLHSVGNIHSRNRYIKKTRHVQEYK